MSTTTASARSTRNRRTELVCAECGWHAPKWVGRCTECGAWSSLQERPVAGAGRSGGRAAGGGLVLHSAEGAALACPISQIDPAQAAYKPTGLAEFDRVLGGGLVPGGVILLAGEPGVGKSTLLLAATQAVASLGVRVLYATGEESVAQVRARAERVGALHPELYLAADTDLERVAAAVESVNPALLVVDSVQTLTSAEVDGVPGGVSQVREVTAALTSLAKNRNVTTIVVGHVTKDGSVAGPRTLEHLVDVVLQFEGDRHSRLRTLRAVKNRFGPSDELGCFELTDAGIAGVSDPSGLFVTRHPEPVPGTCLTVALEGRRALLTEVQALVARGAGPVPRRTTAGVDSSRAELVLAVLHRRAGVAIGAADAYLATVGGAKVTEPAADLAMALAAASSVTDRPLPGDLVAIGEVGLAGEVRRVAGAQRRLAEAARIGVQAALVPPDPDLRPIRGLKVTTVATVADAIREVLTEQQG